MKARMAQVVREIMNSGDRHKQDELMGKTRESYHRDQEIIWKGKRYIISSTAPKLRGGTP